MFSCGTLVQSCSEPGRLAASRQRAAGRLPSLRRCLPCARHMSSLMHRPPSRLQSGSVRSASRDWHRMLSAPFTGAQEVPQLGATLNSFTGFARLTRRGVGGGEHWSVCPSVRLFVDSGAQFRSEPGRCGATSVALSVSRLTMVTMVTASNSERLL